MRRAAGLDGETVELCSRAGAVLVVVLILEVALLLHGDAVSERRQLRRDQPDPPVALAAGDGRPAAAGAAELPQPPKVALLFLSRGAMPLEPLWRIFLEGAGSGSGWREWFSLLTHPPPGFSYPPVSLFAGTEVPARVPVEWGQPSVVVAERALLRAALRDPANQRFLLLSESCVPLYPAPAVWLQLTAERRSRVNACANASDAADVEWRMDFRWHPAMAAAGVGRRLWRKSSQWVALVRPHAELVEREVAVFAAFERHCYAAPASGTTPERFCAADEHYIPSLLVARGLEAEAACAGTLTHAKWDGPLSQPHTYGVEEATQAALAEMRGPGCDAGLLKRRGVAFNLSAGPPAAAPVLPPRCPLFGRKVDAAAASAWLALLRPELS